LPPRSFGEPGAQSVKPAADLLLEASSFGLPAVERLLAGRQLTSELVEGSL
jgi:hypothetical protein